MSFDQVPPCPTGRKQRMAVTCAECEHYFADGGQLQVSGRHRNRKCPTPPGFWDFYWPDNVYDVPIEECLLPLSNKYDRVVIRQKIPFRTVPSKQGWTCALKDQNFERVDGELQDRLLTHLETRDKRWHGENEKDQTSDRD
ncbi:hypothetical protein JTE90_003921 [Oedothorax gibbosus]|uniref:Uncharacterized protein n=1 Tax=Oedothorax gibbosus TaxID=931172 RepID=A0AAV6TLT2_9ARAC|nr:hypothetical protein JTE90_003921 [Oedothorax gibbosus]